MTYREKFDEIICRLKNIKRADTKGSTDYYTYLTISTDKTDEEEEIVKKIYLLKEYIEQMEKANYYQKRRIEKQCDEDIEIIEEFLSIRELKF